jgi:hypothetical protein
MYYVVLFCVLVAGGVLGRASNLSIEFLMSFTTLVIGLSAFYIAFRAYRLWSKPIIANQLNDLSDIISQRQLNYAELRELISKQTQLRRGEAFDSDEMAVWIWHGLGVFLTKEKALWFRGEHIISSLFVYKIKCKDVQDLWLKSHLEFQMPNHSASSDIWECYKKLDGDFKVSEITLQLLREKLISLLN